MMTKNTTIGDILGLDVQLASLLQRYNFTNYNESLAQLEQKGEMDSAFLVELVDIFVSDENFNVSKLKSFPLTSILDYLKKTHLYYQDRKIPQMENLTSELARCMNKNASEILHFFFLKFSTELTKHIEFEEKNVFPYIQDLIDGKKPENARNSFRLSKFMQYHNDDIEQQLGEFRIHLNTTFSELKTELAFKHFCQHTENFEKDLKLHAAIEDDLLMPRALKIEQQLLND